MAPRGSWKRKVSVSALAVSAPFCQLRTRLTSRALGLERSSSSSTSSRFTSGQPADYRSQRGSVHSPLQRAVHDLVGGAHTDHEPRGLQPGSKRYVEAYAQEPVEPLGALGLVPTKRDAGRGTRPWLCARSNSFG